MNKLVETKSSEQAVLKKSAFFSLLNALQEERYEECPYWIYYAKLCGAKKSEITKFLINPALILREAA